jgi:hypothetical protein
MHTDAGPSYTAGQRAAAHWRCSQRLEDAPYEYHSNPCGRRAHRLRRGSCLVRRRRRCGHHDPRAGRVRSHRDRQRTAAAGAVSAARGHRAAYNACGRQVYFVKEEWVQDTYYRAHPGKGPPKHGNKGHGKGRKDD